VKLAIISHFTALFSMLGAFYCFICHSTSKYDRPSMIAAEKKMICIKNYELT
jgi:hypothetical protein